MDAKSHGMNVVKALKTDLELIGPRQFPFNTANRRKYLNYIQRTGLLRRFRAFHGNEADTKLRSIVKSIMKGDTSDLPIAFDKVLTWKLPALKKFVNEFLESLNIRQNLTGMASNALVKHIKRYKYEKLLGISKEEMPKKVDKEEKSRKPTTPRRKTKQKGGALDTAAFVIPETPTEDTRNRIADLSFGDISGPRDVYAQSPRGESPSRGVRTEKRLDEIRNAASKVQDVSDKIIDKLPVEVLKEEGGGRTVISISSNSTMASKLLNNEELFEAERDMLYEFVERLQDEGVKRRYNTFLQHAKNRSGFKVLRRNLKKEVREENTADFKGKAGPQGAKWDHEVYKWRRCAEIARLKHEARKFDLVAALQGGWHWNEGTDEWQWKGPQKIPIDSHPVYPRQPLQRPLDATPAQTLR